MGPGFLIILVGALAAIALTKSKQNGDQKPGDNRPTGEDDWGISEENVLVDSGTYVGQLGEGSWRIYEDPDGYFLFEWRIENRDGGGSGFPTQDEAGETLWLELQQELGPELHPDTGEPLRQEGEEEEDRPPLLKDDWGISTTSVVVEGDVYDGERAEAEWRIYESPAGTFFYVYRSALGGGGKRDFETEEDAGEALFDELERELGPEKRHLGLEGRTISPDDEVGP